MYTFRAKHDGKVQKILLSQNMQLQEFINSLQALQYTLDFPEGNILGFKDNQGMHKTKCKFLNLII